jgi:hypothetical protein
MVSKRSPFDQANTNANLNHHIENLTDQQLAE